MAVATRSPSSVFGPFDARPPATPPGAPKGSSRRLRWVVNAIVPVALTVVAAILVLLPRDLAMEARVALFGFSVAVILWSTTSLNAAYVSLATVMLLILAGGASQEALFESLASDVVWLMIGAFILGGAVELTGLAGRMTSLVVRRAHSVRSVFWLVSGLLVVLSFVIPSTSGRAAVTLPLFRSISSSADDPRVTRALALLMPSVILVATIATLIGAGSHLIANDLLERIAGDRITFAQWALYGLPFAVAASVITCWVIQRMFLDAERRERPLKITVADDTPLTRGERTTLIITALMLCLWLSESFHGLEIATVTVLGALALTMPGLGVMSWKAGLKAVSWNLVIFVGAALALGRALIDTRAAQWVIENLFAASGLAETDSALVALVLISVLALTSHVYITSHAARAAALVPPLLYFAQSTGLDPTAVLFISTVGMNYCLTFPVSSKALLMYQELDRETYQPSDLLRLSAVMLLAHIALIVIFALTYWRAVGLAL